MIEIITSAGHKYYYEPKSNRFLTHKPDFGSSNCEPSTFLLSNNYDFNHIKMYTIEVTQQCNQRCTYCIYSGNHKGHRQHNATVISDENLKKCIEFVKNHAGDNEEIIVSFYGGEALLAFEKIRQIVEALHKEYDNIEFNISTNGLLLSETIINWSLLYKRVKFTVTIDGSQSVHDSRRVTAKGKGTWSNMMRNLEFFKDKYPEEYKRRLQFISTVDTMDEKIALLKFWENNELLNFSYPEHISFIKHSDQPCGDIKSEEWRKYMLRGMSDALSGIESFYSRDFLKNISRIERRQIVEIPHCQKFVTCLNEMYGCFINAEGKLYLCEKFCDDLSIGDLQSGIDLRKVKEINEAFLNRKNHHCVDCFAKRLCRICATNLNHDEKEFIHLCQIEKERLYITLQLYCEYLEQKKYFNN